MAGAFLSLDLADEAATAAFAEDVAVCLAFGDTVTLAGGLGAGKTTFARALIRALTSDPELEVPSPTFTLVQSYEGRHLTVAHVDLYRLSDPAEIDEIGLSDALATGAAVIEWPERADARLPGNGLGIALQIAGTGRRASVSGPPAWEQRLSRSRAARAFLTANGRAAAHRFPIAGDVSARRYERVVKGSDRTVLMDWPPRPQPPEDPRAPYRAHDVRAYLAVDAGLRAAGFSAPAIHAHDASAGFVLMEDFGDRGIAVQGAPLPERYRIAVAVLAAIHRQPRPAELPLPDGTRHRLPALNAEALAADIALFAEWYVPHAAAGAPLSEPARAEFNGLWSGLFARVTEAEQSWVLFDVQSANLFWLPDCDGVRRIGLIDFQDMFVGPAAYDVASLCQDARAPVPAPLESELVSHYVALRRADTGGFDTEAFLSAYAILATARALKNLGVFARQADRFGDRRYLRHIPPIANYLVRNFAHPVLSDLAVWYERHLPPLTSASK